MLSFLKDRTLGAALTFALVTLPACSEDAGTPAAGGAATSGGANSAGSAALGGAGSAAVAGSASGGGNSAGSGQGAAGAGAGGSSAGAGGSSAGAGGSSAGGSAGSNAGGGGAGGAAAGGAAAGAIVSDDFEGTAVGSPPNPALFSVRGSGTVQVSTEVPRPGGGQKVVKVVSGGSGATLFLNKSAFPLPNGVVHFRVWMRFVNADWSNHVAFIQSSPGMESQEVRFGGQNNAYHANLAADGDGLSPDPFAFPSCAKCIKPVADEWKCLRGMFDFTNSRARLYVGEALAVDAEKDAVKNDWHSGTGTLPMNATELGFGWAMYGGSQNTVYYDDLAIGHTEISCN